jgi:hypothetical protein
MECERRYCSHAGMRKSVASTLAGSSFGFTLLAVINLVGDQ